MRRGGEGRGGFFGGKKKRGYERRGSDGRADVCWSDQVPQDIDNALSQSNAKTLLSSSKFTELKTQVKDLVGHKGLRSFFDPANNVYCERPLLTETGEVIRPDRFVITKNNDVFLLDYKTGVHKKNHESQIDEYARALNKGTVKIKQKTLVYINSPITIKNIKTSS